MRCRERVTPSDSGILPVASRYVYTAKNPDSTRCLREGLSPAGNQHTQNPLPSEVRAGSRRNRQRGVQERDERECARSENLIWRRPAT